MAILTDEQRAARAPWGRFEEASNDAINTLWQVVGGLPEGDARDAIEDYMRGVDDYLNGATQVAIDAAHATM